MSQGGLGGWGEVEAGRVHSAARARVHRTHAATTVRAAAPRQRCVPNDEGIEALEDG